MIPLVDTRECEFGSQEELRTAIAAQHRQDYVAPSSEITLDEDGIVHAGRFAGPLARPALEGLCKTLAIPVEFACGVCPADLLAALVRRLATAQDISLRVQTTDGTATGILPADRQVIRHDMLLDCLGADEPIQYAALSVDVLRISTIQRQAERGDAFGFGWDVLNNEDGWQGISAHRFLVRMICVNGMVGFDKTASFRRTWNRHQPIGKSLLQLVDIVRCETDIPELETAVKWASDTPVGSEQEPVLQYLARRLEGDVTMRALGEISQDTVWYNLLNHLTNQAKNHHLEMRRRYELEGGLLLRWFFNQGRGRPYWRKPGCATCKALNDN